MDNEKTFSIEQPDQRAETNYHDSILNIINDLELQVRSINPNAAMFSELHEKRHIDARSEIQKYEGVRKDVCESFGIQDDDQHMYMYKGNEVGVQRAHRVFFVLIDTVSKEGFYGEGRTDHITLYMKLCEMLAKYDSSATFETVSTNQMEPPRYLVFKGFLSTEEFDEISDVNRRVLETPIVDNKGKKINTPNNWFITGHNLPESSK